MNYSENYEKMEEDAKFVLAYLEKKNPNAPTYCKSVLLMAHNIAKFKDDLWIEEIRQKQFEAQQAAQMQKDMEEVVKPEEEKIISIEK
jgi:hypothetical protein